MEIICFVWYIHDEVIILFTGVYFQMENYLSSIWIILSHISSITWNSPHISIRCFWRIMFMLKLLKLKLNCWSYEGCTIFWRTYFYLSRYILVLWHWADVKIKSLSFFWFTLYTEALRYCVCIKIKSGFFFFCSFIIVPKNFRSKLQESYSAQTIPVG